MSSIQKNVASQKTTFGLVSASTGAALTSATFTSAAWVTVDGTQAGFAGTFTTLGNGQFQYAPTQGETNGTNVGIFIAPSGAVPVNLDFHTDVVDANGLLEVDVVDWKGGAVPTPNVTGVPLIDLKYTLGTLSPAAAGSVSPDWAQVVNKTSTVALSATTIGTVTTVTNQLTAAAIATGVWQDTTTGDFTTSASIGKSIMNGVSLGTGLTINGYTGNTPQTGDAYARLGAPAGASVSADVAALKTDLDAGVNVVKINGNATAAANVEHTNQALCRGTVGSSSTTTSVICSAIASPSSAGASGQFIGRVILFDADTTTANLQGQATNITANTTGSTPTFTVTALTTAPVSGDTFTIV